MKNHLKAACYTVAVIMALWLFVWACVVTEGAAAAVLIVVIIIGLLYALIYGIVSGKIDDW